MKEKKKHRPNLQQSFTGLGVTGGRFSGVPIGIMTMDTLMRRKERTQS